MKKLLALLLALVMVIGLAACGAKQEAAPAATEAAPAATEAAPAATEAAAPEASAVPTMYAITGPSEVFEIPWFNAGPHTWVKAMFEPLIGFDAKGDPTLEAGMASAYTFAEDGLTASVTLRDGLKWHDGNPVTTDDVLWSLKTCAELTDTVQALVKGGATNIDFEKTTVDGNTINFVFKAVNVTQLQAFCQTHILPKHCLENSDATVLQQDAFWQAPIGSGPWKLESCVMGEYANLVPFEE